MRHNVIVWKKHCKKQIKITKERKKKKARHNCKTQSDRNEKTR